jgi:hypothetical protein
MFDEETRNFSDSEFAPSPSTHVVLDVESEVCAIAKHTEIAPRGSRIGTRLQELLNATILQPKISFVVVPIQNPHNFLERIEKAVAVRHFSFGVGRPNAFDVEEYFIRPAQQLVREMDSDDGRMAVDGKDLDRGLVAELARSSAATGQPVAAKILDTQEGRPIRIRMGGPPDFIIFQEEAPESDEQRRSVLRALRSLYARVRGVADGGQTL